uniref:Uncharacterized protein n=1 Tax=Helianthus annuus TaxID=4232 RepID=A0A251TUU0_HELAN
MVDPPYKRIELYLKGLAPEIQSHVTSANLDDIQAIQRLAHRITDQREQKKVGWGFQQGISFGSVPNSAASHQRLSEPESAIIGQPGAEWL